MLKRIGVIAGTAAAGLVMLGGVASADGGHTLRVEDDDQVGLANLNNIDALHNVSATLGVCDNNVNVLGVQVPVHDVLNGVGVPILSPGANEASGEDPYNCASGGIEDGGNVQDN
ncbi:hypothetical protein [Amycolatopsis magusensis]|uniref:Small secreted domain n=1 Tax=Amycolatopsis magusensis TaxID=882444 RepID=A0ABS4Q0V1_9PSEU|nr:hypothetical protein [Amycolatopsis magusensis]MBP2185301.1 hypothetical protein [Amycolatopsis magusensis]MDI5978818.1 hypothetical protein [Amycolatopsis magusensis]